jgi:hypothetical protein
MFHTHLRILLFPKFKLFLKTHGVSYQHWLRYKSPVSNFRQKTNSTERFPGFIGML